MGNKQKYSGIIPPTVTPLHPDETLDVEATRRLVEHCIKGGVSGLFVNGTSGEAMRVTDTVWKDITRVVLEQTAARIPVLCGAIDTSTIRVIEKLKTIESLGGEIAVCTPPFYLPSFGQDEIQRHFDKICRSTSLKIAVYNIPETTNVNILPETMVSLADNENIIAYKDSTANWQQLQRAIFALENKDIAVFNGAEELSNVSLMSGAQGLIPGLANFVPQIFVELYELVKQGRFAESLNLQKRINSIRSCLMVNGCWMSSMKFLLEAFEIGSKNISSCLPELTGKEQQKALQILYENNVEVRVHV